MLPLTNSDVSYFLHIKLLRIIQYSQCKCEVEIFQSESFTKSSIQSRIQQIVKFRLNQGRWLSSRP